MPPTTLNSEEPDIDRMDVNNMRMYLELIMVYASLKLFSVPLPIIFQYPSVYLKK